MTPCLTDLTASQTDNRGCTVGEKAQLGAPAVETIPLQAEGQDKWAPVTVVLKDMLRISGLL